MVSVAQFSQGHGDLPRCSGDWFLNEFAMAPQVPYARRRGRDERPRQKEIQMKIRHQTLLSLTIASLVATTTLVGQVRTDYDRSADFNRYATYSWEAVQAEEPLAIDRIKSAVNAALAAKGWKQVESGGDVSIMAMEMTEDHRTLRTYYDTFGSGLGWAWGGGFGDGFGSSTTTETTYTVGTLVVDLFDTSTKKLIWRGSAMGTLTDKSDNNIKLLNKGVRKMFDRFPSEKRRTQQ
jgi:hypothetical protein